MKAERWTAVSASAFEWEREALDFARANLPDHEPWRAWSNFEFIDDEGRVNEVDLLVLTPAGLILVEIKSRPGTVKGDAASWTWLTEGRPVTTDNPLPLANRKAKRLGAVLKRQAALGGRAPWVEPLIFLSKITARPALDPGTEKRVVLRGRPGQPGDPGLIGTLLHADELGFGRRGTIDHNAARGITQAIRQAGIRRPGRGRRVGDYELGQLLTEGPDWQDFVAKHTATGSARRVRIYPYANALPEERDRMARAAKREFTVLEGVEHPGIQRALDLREAELGPALVFDYDPDSTRLDRYLAQCQATLSLGQRLGLIRQLGEAMAYAHGKRIYHRGLAPQNVLVRAPAEDKPRLQVTNWQIASRAAGAGATTLGTRHADDYLSDPVKVYLAPEASGDVTDDAARGAAQADVFSLGAIAYLILSGRAPARSPLDLPAMLKEGNGLRLSGVVNGVGEYLEELVRGATAPMVRDRPRDGREFLEYLSLAEDEARPPEPAPAARPDPATAGKGDVLEGDLVFVRRLGSGGTAIAALVHPVGDEANELVLKVATDPAHADRIRAEAEALRRLRHPNIVRLDREMTAAGRPALLMERAGDRTLAQWIRGGDPLSLDLMRRFGEHLIQAVEHLEEKAVAHRDIKPDNIGVARSGASGAYRLVLFDFSLTRAPAENIAAGTRPYLDPFLANRRPPRWDLHAERYAASVTLHEMLAGAPPLFGDGSIDPIATDDDATVALDRFDPVLRDSLGIFFNRAFRRDAAERFGNAQEMFREWGRAFAPMDRTADAPESIEVIAPRLDAGSGMAEVGYGVEARAVLNDRMGIHTVRQLLGVPRQKFRYLTGVGDRVRREIRERAKRLADLRKDLVPGGITTDSPAAAAGRASVDLLAEQLIARRPAGDERPEDRILANLLGFEGDAPWPAAGEVAAMAQTARSRVADVLEGARDRWHKSADLNGVRAELADLLMEAGGVATVDELAAQLLAARGSTQDDEAERLRRARAVLRAAVELEASTAPTRFRAYAEASPVLIARSAMPGDPSPAPDGPDLAEYARRLGRAADTLAAEVPLPSLARVDAELGLAPLPDRVEAFAADRVRRLAAAASATAALSGRLELYPRGMQGLTALRLSLGALSGPRRLAEADIQARVRGRFPDAEPLPGRPALDALLDQAGADRDWREIPGEEPGFVARAVADTASGGNTTDLPPRKPTMAAAAEVTLEVRSAQLLEDKIVHAARTGLFLALTVEPHRAARAEAELVGRFPREVVSLERLMLQAMRDEAEARRVRWPVALAADAAPRASPDFRNLLRLAARAAPQVKRALLDLRVPALLTRPGLLARYELMDLLNAVSQASGASDGPPSVWLLLPQADSGLPLVDGAVLPVISAANWARLSRTWLQNAHRTGGRAAA